MELMEELSDEEQERLLEMKDDPEIREKLIIHNLKLVKWVANKYYSKGINSRDDLFQQGVLGLIRAIENYEVDKGVFSSYAVTWIKQSIGRYIYDHSRTIRIPEHVKKLERDLNRARNELAQELGKDPTPEEISVKMKISIKKVNEILNVTQDITSLNTVIGEDDGDLTMEDSIPDDGPTPDEIVTDRVYMEQLKGKLKSMLTTLEYNSLMMFYGANDPKGKSCTIEVIADIYNKTPSQISRARDNGIDKIKSMHYTNMMTQDSK